MAFLGNYEKAYAQEIIVQTSEEVIKENEEVIEENQEVIKTNEEIKNEELGVQNEQHPVVILKIGSKEVWIDGGYTEIVAAPQIIENRIYLPLKFVVENILEAKLSWNEVQKRIVITKDYEEVSVSLQENKIYKDGKEVSLEVPFVVEEGITFAPLRFIQEEFGIAFEYSSSKNILTIKKPIKEQPNEEEIEVIDGIPPVAYFEFMKEVYIEGELVRAVDLSKSEESYIAERRWMLSGDERRISSQVDALFSKPQAGEYTLSLQVKDARGIWSEWFTQEISILPNNPPVIQDIITNKKSYAIGESIKIDYTFENEEWESIVAERWSYKPTHNSQNNIISAKPHAIYAEGEFIVTLEIRDEYGHWSEKKEFIIQITDKVVETEFEYIFKQGKIGSIINNLKGLNFREYKEAEAFVIGEISGTYIMSNSPESVKQKGLLYEEVASGIGRFMLHHINEFSELENKMNPKRLILKATNETEDIAILTMNKKTIRGPSADVIFIGHQMLYEYLNIGTTETIVLLPGETTLIYDRRWTTGQAISGMFDFNIVGQIKFTVGALDAREEIENLYLMGLPIKDTHPRGTYNVLEKVYSVELGNEKESKALVLGRHETNEWLQGIDTLTGEIVYNRGNYGMFYRIIITAKEDTAVILNPRGDIFKGAIQWVGEIAHIVPGSGLFTSNNKAAYIGMVKKGETKELLYMLPNASSAPVLLGFIPESEWGK
jgi:hypothetical protein